MTEMRRFENAKPVQSMGKNGGAADKFHCFENRAGVSLAVLRSSKASRLRA